MVQAFIEMGFCWISPPNSYFLYSDSKLDDSYLFFDRHDERNTKYQNLLCRFGKPTKFVSTAISVINLFCLYFFLSVFCPYFAINIIIDTGLAVSVWILCCKIIIQSSKLNF